jgi:hypothetical protein
MLLALSRSAERFKVDLAAPLWTARYLGIPPRAALALALRPEHWPLALWRPEECTAPDWPAVDVAVALLAAVDGCKAIKYDGAAGASEYAMDAMRVAAQHDGVRLQPLHSETSPGFRLMTAEEILDEVYAWMGADIKGLVLLSPKLAAGDPVYAAAVALGAVKLAGGAYMPEPQVTALLSVLARRGRKGGEDGEGEARKREAGRRQAERGPAREKGARKVERRTSSFSPQRREEA